MPKSEELRLSLQNISNEELHSRLEQLDPKRARQLHRNDRFRLQSALEIVSLLGQPMSELAAAPGERHRAFTIRMLCPRPILNSRIEQRIAAMLGAGLIMEVKALLEGDVNPACKPMQSIGYAEVCSFLQGQISAAQLPEQMAISTRQYAKRQETWFSKLEFDAYWSEADNLDALINRIEGLTASPR